MLKTASSPTPGTCPKAHPALGLLRDASAPLPRGFAQPKGPPVVRCADSGANRPFRNEVGRCFRFEAGHLFWSIPATRSDLKSAIFGVVRALSLVAT
jgi:hypothetical protein